MKLNLTLINLIALSSIFLNMSAFSADHPGYIEAPERRTTGIGKFYMGREISFVMGHRAAGWLNRPERIQEEMPDDVVENMRLDPNHVVADIGAGSGYFFVSDRFKSSKRQGFCGGYTTGNASAY